MRRSAALIVILALMLAPLWATGVVTVKVNPPTIDSVSASALAGDPRRRAASAPLAIWVELAKVSKPGGAATTLATRVTERKGPPHRRRPLTGGIC